MDRTPSVHAFVYTPLDGSLVNICFSIWLDVYVSADGCVKQSSCLLCNNRDFSPHPRPGSFLYSWKIGIKLFEDYAIDVWCWMIKQLNQQSSRADLNKSEAPSHFAFLIFFSPTPCSDIKAENMQERSGKLRSGNGNKIKRNFRLNSFLCFQIFIQFHRGNEWWDVECVCLRQFRKSRKTRVKCGDEIFSTKPVDAKRILRRERKFLCGFCGERGDGNEHKILSTVMWKDFNLPPCR